MEEVKVGQKVWYSRYPGEEESPGRTVNTGTVIRMTTTQIVVKSDRGHKLKFRKKDFRKAGCGDNPLGWVWMYTRVKEQVKDET